MTFAETELKGAFVLEREPAHDERGFFARMWCQKEFAARGLNSSFVQASVSFNRARGTLRGLHYQAAPYAEAKLVHCIRGAIYDVIVDLRPDSISYRYWVAVELSADNGRMLYIPEGVAHGFQTLRDDTEVCYYITEFHTPGTERGVRWNDPLLNVQWPEVEHRIMSEKDRAWPVLVAEA
jgi:dTDP-4-dehydrorhamnose 3,5-epimerase